MRRQNAWWSDLIFKHVSPLGEFGFNRGDAEVEGIELGGDFLGDGEEALELVEDGDGGRCRYHAMLVTKYRTARGRPWASYIFTDYTVGWFVHVSFVTQIRENCNYSNCWKNLSR